MPYLLNSKSYVQQLTSALNTENSDVLTRVIEAKIDQRGAPQLGVTLDGEYADFAESLYKAGIATSVDVERTELENALSAFSKVLTSQTSWIVEPLKALLRRVRKVAIRSAMEAGKVEVLGNAARIMQALFPALLRDRAAWEDSKKPAALSLTVELFRLYFAINNLNLCKNLVRNVDSGQLPDPLKEDPSFPYQRGDAVSYAFYAGRLALLENKFQLADRLLSFAYRHSPRGHQNLKAILKYLIPVRLRRGLLPRNELLQRNGLSEFVPIAGAIRSGNLRQLNECLDIHQEIFVRWGIYLLLERLRPIVMRTLIKRVQGVMGEGVTRVPLDAIDKAVRFADADVDSDENECVIANLIFSGYIRGYIAHQRRTLVVAGKDPFPALTSVTAKD